MSSETIPDFLFGHERMVRTGDRQPCSTTPRFSRRDSSVAIVVWASRAPDAGTGPPPRSPRASQRMRMMASWRSVSESSWVRRDEEYQAVYHWNCHALLSVRQALAVWVAGARRPLVAALTARVAVAE